MMKTSLVLALAAVATLGCGGGKDSDGSGGSANTGGQSTTHHPNHTGSGGDASGGASGTGGDASGGSSATGGGGTVLPPSDPAPINIHNYVDGQGLAFCEWLPSNYGDNDELYPVVFTMHGVGEAGQCGDSGCAPDTDQALLTKMTANGALKLIQNDPSGHYFLQHPALVFAPQHPSGWYNAGTNAQFQEYILAHYRVDPKRIYVTGLSAGGGATWDWARDFPTFFAAIMPIAGASAPTAGMAPPAEIDLPVWAFHDFDDGTVTRQNSCAWTGAIAGAEISGAGVDPCASYPGQNGGAASDTETAIFDTASKTWSWKTGVDSSGKALMRFTMYPNGGHDAWTKTYENDVSWDWLFSRHR